MLQLNLPTYSFKIKKENEKHLIFDQIRRRYVVLTPEEWVRQNFVSFLSEHKKFPKSLIANEVSIKFNGLKKRCDTLIYNRQGEILLIVEYKAPHIHITQEVFDQIAIYNMKLRVQYMIVSNGIEHYCCRIDYEKSRYEFLQEIPEFEELHH
jgi:hypothetical protein